MDKKNVRTTVQCLLCLICLLGLNCILFHFYVQVKMDMRTVWIASRDIPPRTVIKEKDMTSIRVPGAYLMDHALTDRKDILGRITDIQGKIPAGSVFYKTMLYDPEKIPDHAIRQLQPGQTLYTVKPDAASLSSLIAGMRTDIHFTAERKNEPALTGCLIRHARIASIRDARGVDINDPESSGIPAMAELAVSAGDVELLSFAETCGSLRLFASADPYGTDQEAQADEDSEVMQWLSSRRESKTKD